MKIIPRHTYTCNNLGHRYNTSQLYIYENHLELHVDPNEPSRAVPHTDKNSKSFVAGSGEGVHASKTSQPYTAEQNKGATNCLGVRGTELTELS